MLLGSVPPGAATWTCPVKAPAGTIAEISGAETSGNAAVPPLKVTLVAAFRSVPGILAAFPVKPYSVVSVPAA